MSHAAAVLSHADPAESPLTPESWGKLGMWVFLVGDAMSFGGLLAAYAALRLSAPDWPVPADILGIQLTAVMTFLLICTSVTMVKGLDAIRNGDRPGLVRFLMLTVVGGALFLGLQAYEWNHLMHAGGVTLTQLHGEIGGAARGAKEQGALDRHDHLALR